MKAHLHTDIVQIAIGAIGTALAFHGFRLLGAKMAQNDRLNGIGTAIGAAFTFK